MLERILDEAIRLELSLSRLYLIFKDQHPKDAKFWDSMAKEEQGHASQIEKFKMSLKDHGLESKEYSNVDLTKIMANNTQTQRLIDEFDSGVSRELAFRTAVKLENSASEEHYRIIFDSEIESRLTKVFQGLSLEDKKHYNRLLDYIEKKNIQI